MDAYVLIQRLHECLNVIKSSHYVLRDDDMLAYYLSDRTTLLQDKEGERCEVSTINLICADDEILCFDRRLQRFITSCLSKKPFRLSQMPLLIGTRCFHIAGL